MRVLRAADYPRMPWKNGGGETAEILVEPAGAPLDSFDWRLSMARVAADGPFSLFPGVERTPSFSRPTPRRSGLRPTSPPMPPFATGLSPTSTA